MLVLQADTSGRSTADSTEVKDKGLTFKEMALFLQVTHHHYQHAKSNG